MKTTAFIIVAGFAAAASAQTMTMYWTFDEGDDLNGDGAQTLSNGPNGPETGIAYLMARMDPGATGFAGSIFDFIQEGGPIHGVDTYDPVNLGTLPGTWFFDNLLDELGDDGNPDPFDDHRVTNVEAFQLPPFFNDDFVADNPIRIGVLTLTPGVYVPGIIPFTTENHLNFDVYTDDFGTSIPYEGIVEGSFFNVVPAPASVALLGLGGLVAVRRRR